MFVINGHQLLCVLDLIHRCLGSEDHICLDGNDTAICPESQRCDRSTLQGPDCD